MRVKITGGQVHDVTKLTKLLEGVWFFHWW